jgi:hypothetical protein
MTKVAVRGGILFCDGGWPRAEIMKRQDSEFAKA